MRLPNGHLVRFRPNSAWGSIETTIIGKRYPTHSFGPQKFYNKEAFLKNWMFESSSYINIFISYFCNGNPLSTYNFLNVYFISYLSDQKLNVKFWYFMKFLLWSPVTGAPVSDQPKLEPCCSKVPTLAVPMFNEILNQHFS